MKQILKSIFLALVMAALWACTPSPIHTPLERLLPTDAESVMFQQPEKFFKNDDLEQALAGYSRYLGQYPHGRYADQAYGRIGAIYMRRGALDAARAFYQRLIADFPGSPLRNEARLAIIDLQILDQQMAEAIALALQMLAENPDDLTRRQIWQRLAEQYDAGGAVGDAAAFAYLLYKSAPDPQKAEWAGRLKENIGRMGAEDIARLWDQMDDPMARGYLMYRRATLQVMADNFDDALELLTAFAGAYPEHEYIQDARLLIADLEQRLRFTPGTLGCLLPLSGPYQIYGQRALNGIEMALGLFQSGENSLPVKLVIKDSASEEVAATQGVRDLVNAGAGAIIGPIVAAPAAALEAQKLNITMVTFTQKADITAIGDFIFRHFITPQSQVRSLVGYFIRDVGLRDFAIMYPREAYGQTFMTLFWDEVIHQGGQVVGVEAYDTQQTDFAANIRKLIGTYFPVPYAFQRRSRVQVADGPYFKRNVGVPQELDDVVPDPVTRLTGLYYQGADQDRAKGPALGRQREEEGAEPIIDFDVLFIPDAPKTAALILPQLAYHDAQDIYLAGTNLWHSAQLIEMAGDYAQNAIMVDGFFKESSSPAVQRFVEMFKSIYETEPGIIEAFAFDTARVLIGILAQPDLQMRHHLRDTLLQVAEVDGVTGPLAFDQDGEAIKSLNLLRVKGKRFVEIPRQ